VAADRQPSTAATFRHGWRIWKFALPMPDPNGRSFVDMPAEVEPLSVAQQGDEMVVWAVCDPDAPPEEGYTAHGPRRFIVVNTGDVISSLPGGARFLGTVTSDNGIVWHVWDGDAGTTA
jgi:hypothetical protein